MNCREVDKFLSQLFSINEFTCFSIDHYGTYISQMDEYGPYDAFFSVNPMDPTKTRADYSVVKYRNILIEMDKIPLDQQDQHISEIGMPYSTAVFSGKKSVHYIISLEQELPNESAYRALVKRVYKAVGEDKVDISCKNPSRFSRLPGHIRSDTGKEQKLLAIRGRVPNSVLEEWLQKRGIGQEENWEPIAPWIRPDRKSPHLLRGATKNFLMFGAEKGEWNINLFKAAADLCRCGFTEQEAQEELLQITGTLDFTDKKTISSAFSAVLRGI